MGVSLFLSVLRHLRTYSGPKGTGTPNTNFLFVLDFFSLDTTEPLNSHGMMPGVGRNEEDGEENSFEMDDSVDYGTSAPAEGEHVNPGKNECAYLNIDNNLVFTERYCNRKKNNKTKVKFSFASVFI